jgi:hypothetical protein
MGLAVEQSSNQRRLLIVQLLPIYQSLEASNRLE